MIISIRLTNEEKELADAYARLNGISLSEAMKKAFFEKIEDEYDIVIADEADTEFKNDPETYSLDDVKKELGI